MKNFLKKMKNLKLGSVTDGGKKSTAFEDFIMTVSYIHIIHEISYTIQCVRISFDDVIAVIGTTKPLKVY